MATVNDLDLAIEISEDCKDLVIVDNTDYTNVNFSWSSVTSFNIEAYTPPDFQTYTNAGILNDYKTNAPHERYVVNGNLFGHDQFKDGVWKIVVTINDSSNTRLMTVYKPVYCELLKCIRKRSAQLPALYKECSECYDKNLVESFNLYMVYLQSALFKVQTADYDSANELISAANTMCDFDCGCD
jgi:hypothetical protein